MKHRLAEKKMNETFLSKKIMNESSRPLGPPSRTNGQSLGVDFELARGKLAKNKKIKVFPLLKKLIKVTRWRKK